MWATPASPLLALPTAAVLTSGSGTRVSVSLVSEHKDDAGVVGSGFTIFASRHGCVTSVHLWF